MGGGSTGSTDKLNALRDERLSELRRLREKLVVLEGSMKGYREVMVELIKQLGIGELESDFIQKIDAFFENLEHILKYGNELANHLEALFELETERLAYETHIVEALVGLLDTLEPEAEFKAGELERKRQELAGLAECLDHAIEKLKVNHKQLRAMPTTQPAEVAR